MFPSVIPVIQVLLEVITKQGIFRLITFFSGFSPEVSYKCVVLSEMPYLLWQQPQGD